MTMIVMTECEQPMTREEEHEAFEKLRAGDESQREKILMRNRGFVVQIAARYGHINFESAYASGMMGQLIAIDRFDHTLGYKFISYAVWWIKQAIKKDACDSARLGIGVPFHYPTFKRRIEDLEEAYLQREGEYPSDRYLGKHLGISPSRVREIRNAPESLQSLDQPLKHDRLYHYNTWHDVYPGDTGEKIPAGVEREERSELCEALLSVLDDRSAEIVRRYNGIGQYEPETLEQISRTLGITRERVRQIRESAYQEIRRTLQRERLAGQFLDALE